MLIKEFISLYKESPEKAIQSITIKSRISFVEKVSLLSQIKFNALDTENGVTYYDTLIGEFLLGVSLIKFSTDLEFSDDSMEELDELKNTNAFDDIVSVFIKDYMLIEKHYREQTQSLLKIENDSQNVINQEIIKVSNKAIKTLDDISKNLDKKTLNKLFNGIKDFASKLNLPQTENIKSPLNVLQK